MPRRGFFIPATHAVSGTFDSVRSAVFPHSQSPVARGLSALPQADYAMYLRVISRAAFPEAGREISRCRSVVRSALRRSRPDPNPPASWRPTLPTFHRAAHTARVPVNPRLFGSAAIGGGLNQHKKQTARRQTNFPTLRQMPHNSCPVPSANPARHQQPARQC